MPLTFSLSVNGTIIPPISSSAEFLALYIRILLLKNVVAHGMFIVTLKCLTLELALPKQVQMMVDKRVSSQKNIHLHYHYCNRAPSA